MEAGEVGWGSEVFHIGLVTVKVKAVGLRPCFNFAEAARGEQVVRVKDLVKV